MIFKRYNLQLVARRRKDVEMLKKKTKMVKEVLLILETYYSRLFYITESSVKRSEDVIGYMFAYSVSFITRLYDYFKQNQRVDSFKRKYSSFYLNLFKAFPLFSYERFSSTFSIYFSKTFYLLEFRFSLHPFIRFCYL